mgnify:CR=1
MAKAKKYPGHTFWLGKKLSAKHKRKIAVSRRALFAARKTAGETGG